MAEPEAASAGLADAVLLAPLTEDSFLHNLHTYVGNALVSVNPCRPLPLYSAELCAVVAGAGGAGGGAGGAGGGPAGAALAAAGTLLEAFGNAATARNHNASRFGKLLDIEFDFKGEPVGGHLTHYLLEKERVASVAEGERNFHVLYQLLAGADAHLLKRLKLQRSWETYRVLVGRAEGEGAPASPRRAPPPAPPGPHDPHADRDHFAFTKAAMNALGFSAAECGAVLRVLAFLLKLGNVQFEPHHHIDGSIGTRLVHEYEMREACALVGVDADALALALGAAPLAEPLAEPPPHGTPAPHTVYYVLHTAHSILYIFIFLMLCGGQLIKLTDPRRRKKKNRNLLNTNLL
ncbi:unconventional myosin-Ib-like [Zerene cesonia]|uniref:unconventional myosin-Ib-like n=1 Tax=Zerene cesonia TaxID=33412 RepID=UPI0018E55BFF|nr:unconventional myosin-Ib-like [Zerene cesonia]